MLTYNKLTPGEMILHFLEDMDVSQHQLAKSTGIPASRITEIVKGRRGITADTALRLSAAFGNTAEFWLNLQKQFELEKARQSDGERIASEVTRLQTA